MNPKLHIPFNTQLNEGDHRALNRYIEDPDIQRITVLPSYKRKLTTLSGGEKVLRCDDTVLEAKAFKPEYCDYQIGCGYALVALKLNQAEATTAGLISALKEMAQSEPMRLLPTAARVAGRHLGIHLKQDSLYQSAEVIPPEEWLQAIAQGAPAYLKKRAFQYGLENASRLYSRTPLDIERLRPHLSQIWISGHGARPADDLALSLSGSHYLDISVVESSEFSDITPGTLVVTIHAHGSNFQNLLNPHSMELLRRGKIPPEDCRDLIGLMRKQAEINRASISLKLLRHLRAHFPGISAITVIEQSHREVDWSSETRNYVYYNDSQKLIPNARVLLPAGTPNATSYLLSGGAQTELTENGISHNLKIPARDATSTNSEMTLIEAAVHPFQNCLRQRPNISQKNVPIVQSENCQQLLKTMEQKGVIEHVSKLRPLIRYHVRRWKEKPWTKIGLR